jgi:hypothetical protein
MDAKGHVRPWNRLTETIPQKKDRVLNGDRKLSFSVTYILGAVLPNMLKEYRKFMPVLTVSVLSARRPVTPPGLEQFTNAIRRNKRASAGR